MAEERGEGGTSFGGVGAIVGSCVAGVETEPLRFGRGIGMEVAGRDIMGGRSWVCATVTGGVVSGIASGSGSTDATDEGAIEPTEPLTSRSC